MPDPLTLGVLGAVAATEGIKFLYGQASEVLKAWRERKRAAADQAAAESDADGLEVPVLDSPVLDGRPGSAVVDPAVVAGEEKALIELTGALSPYAQDLAEVDLTDQELAERAARLRSLLEAAYGRRFTFRGEQREPTGTRVTVQQVFGEIAGQVVGVEADAGSGTDVSVDQKADKVTAEGSVTGYRGTLGGARAVSDEGPDAGPDAQR